MGPSGVIGTNKPDAGETVRALLVDYKDRKAEATEAPKPEAVEALLKIKKHCLGFLRGLEKIRRCRNRSRIDKREASRKIHHD